MGKKSRPQKLGKTPKSKHAPSVGKNARSVVAENYDLEKPRWLLSVVDLRGPFGWEQISSKELSRVVKYLMKLESMTWAEIKGKRHHTVQVEGCCRKAKNRLIEIKQDDISELFSIGIGGKPRVFGIRAGECLKILWWDPEHKVYPSIKPNT